MNDQVKEPFRSLLNGFGGSGNSMVDAQDAIQCKVCKVCDTENGHSCTACGSEISELGCEKRHGLCIDCFQTEQFALKN